MNRVLESQARNVTPSGFNTSIIIVNGKNNNGSVYGLVQCRGYLTSSDYKHYASIAMEYLVIKCGRNTSTLIQLDDSFLYYDSQFLQQL